jgi:glycosyltransferase involved in cell wall biosynthesis
MMLRSNEINNQLDLTVVILTYNEERHLTRCLSNIRTIAKDILVVDSFSSDRTIKIANEFSARVLQNKFINHAAQFNWGLDYGDISTEWVLRIDADEYLTDQLINQIKVTLLGDLPNVDGVSFNRRMTFQGRIIRFGGVFPVQVLRLFRYGRGRCENRWMDEHIKVSADTINLSGELIDDNLNSLTWWTDKHNKYASLEALEMLNLEFNFMRHDFSDGLKGCKQSFIKRWLKEVVYSRLPGGLRAFVYFLYRFIIRLGFLDGEAGVAFHFLQGFWYRYLVDVKVSEVKRYMSEHRVDAVNAIQQVLGITVH